MQIETWVVYERRGDKNADRDELRAFRSLDAAQRWAERYSARSGRATSIDWTLQEITRHGRECIDSDSDIAYFAGVA